MAKQQQGSATVSHNPGPPPHEGERVDIESLPENVAVPLRAIIAAHKEPLEVWRLTTAALVGYGYSYGSYMLVAPERKPAIRDVAMVESIRESSSGQILFRIYHGPFLFALAVSGTYPSMTVGEDAEIRGTVIWPPPP